ncbi:MAG TPA: AraC family transcriptional regulator [Chryseolinea sp.]
MDNVFTYLTSPDPGVWGIGVRTCGHQVSQPHQDYPPAKHPASHAFVWEKGRILTSIHLVYIVTGSGIIETKKGERRLLPGDVVLLYPGDWHRYKPDDETGWEEYWVEFNGVMVNKYLLPELFSNPMTTIRNIGYHEEVIYLFQEALLLAQKKRPGFQKILTGIIWQLAAHIAAPGYRANAGPPSLKVYEEVLVYIRHHIKSGVNFKQWARSKGLSYSHFRKLIKDKTTMPPQQLLINERLKLAHRLLTSTLLSVNEVAVQSGFESIYYFSRCFKEKVGVSPSKVKRPLKSTLGGA